MDVFLYQVEDKFHCLEFLFQVFVEAEDYTWTDRLLAETLLFRNCLAVLSTFDGQFIHEGLLRFVFRQMFCS